MMNKEERVLNVINRKPVDYLPSQITFSDRTRDKEISEAIGLSSPSELDGYLENHIAITLTLHDKALFFRNDEESMNKLVEAGYAGVDPEKKIAYDSFGMGIKMHVDGFFSCYGPMGANPELNESAEKYLPESFNREILKMDLETAIKHWKAPDLNKEGNFTEMEEGFKALSGDFLVLPSGYFGVYERAYSLLGWQQFMTEMALRPKMIGDLLDKITEYKVEEAKRKVALGFKIGHYGDDFGNQVTTFFSKKMFRDLFKPRLAKVFKVFKDAGLPVALHCCGKIDDFIPDLIEIGLDVWEPVQPVNDLKFLKQEYGKDLTFWGGIDTQKLPYLSPAQVKEMATETIRILGKGGGYIIAPAQEIMNDVPLENVKAIVETIIEERERYLDY
jgi:uroporphyrinogen decarboxylase